jgi:hypothetical protein
MSAYIQSNSSHRGSSHQASRTPCCAVCRDAGLPNFNTHWVRDRPGGNVVCPYLLSLECRYCHEQGHMPSHCPQLKKKNEERTRAMETAKREAMKPRVDEDGFVQSTSRGAYFKPATQFKRAEKPSKKAGGSFAAFLGDDDEESDVEEQVQVLKPQLTGYAAVVERCRAGVCTMGVPKPKVIVSKPKVIVSKPKVIVPKPKALVDDSDDESEPCGLPWGGSGLSSIRGQKDGWYESDDEED